MIDTITRTSNRRLPMAAALGREEFVMTTLYRSACARSCLTTARAVPEERGE